VSFLATNVAYADAVKNAAGMARPRMRVYDAAIVFTSPETLNKSNNASVRVSNNAPTATELAAAMNSAPYTFPFSSSSSSPLATPRLTMDVNPAVMNANRDTE